MSFPGQDLAREVILPEYRSLGAIEYAWGQGSLVSGYTTDADLDIAPLRPAAEYPGGREDMLLVTAGVSRWASPERELLRTAYLRRSPALEQRHSGPRRPLSVGVPAAVGRKGI